MSSTAKELAGELRKSADSVKKVMEQQGLVVDHWKDWEVFERAALAIEETGEQQR